MQLSEEKLAVLKRIKELKVAFGEGCELAANIQLSPDHSERICESLAADGYLEAIGGRKKYRLSKKGDEVLKK